MSETVPLERRIVLVRGIVQGVGFRPFIHSLANRHRLAGAVWNDAAGVHVEAEGEPEQLDAFLRNIRRLAPPMARIEEVTWQRAAVQGESGFHIETGERVAQRQALVSPDVATCADCLAELFNPSDRRYRYPFISCMNCGPRFTITRSAPYVRADTTMAEFQMCPECLHEFEDPSDRRFHAQPNACPHCGPLVGLVDWAGRPIETGSIDSIAAAAEMLRAGAIIAVKGWGGYDLACNPFDASAVSQLRSRKGQQDRPLALMVRDLDQARSLCEISAEEVELLASPARPIVLLARRDDAPQQVAPDVAPRQRTLGIMLACTPLHHLLLADAGIPLVMTSGNRADEPTAYGDEEAREQLGLIADCFLVHARAIHTRCDDSVVRHVAGGIYPLRRSRGLAPAPLTLEQPVKRHTLACGGELENTFCLARGDQAFLSHHIGDLENAESMRSFEEGVEHYSRLFDVQPELVVHDLHPGYASTRYARAMEERGVAAIGVQHHHAHIASCLADNRRPREERVIGVALDGAGHGTDGAIWGGEVFAGSVAEGFTRRAHLAYVPLPGGEAAMREPWRMAVAHLAASMSIDQILSLPLPFLDEVGEERIRAVGRMVQAGINAPPTSSAGLLFDAVASLLGVPGSIRTGYEGQAAIELELLARGPSAVAYPSTLRSGTDGWVAETGAVPAAILADLATGTAPEEIAARFHRTMAEIVDALCRRIRLESGLSAIALSGGTFQNMLLLGQVLELLRASDFTVYLHRRVPAGDGGLSLGQAVLGDSISRAGSAA